MSDQALPRIKKCWVNADYCLWHTFCVTEAPSVMKAGAENESPTFSVSDDATLNRHAKEIFSAAAVCPVAAITIELEDGSVIHNESPSFESYARAVRES
jgi:ferredoxin